MDSAPPPPALARSPSPRRRVLRPSLFLLPDRPGAGAQDPAAPRPPSSSPPPGGTPALSRRHREDIRSQVATPRRTSAPKSLPRGGPPSPCSPLPGGPPSPRSPPLGHHPPRR
uniref:Uncharacterized protein n=1 Tax=Arundo donax TaxID=35708 RepID=A0A0A9HID8_ARUDO